MRQVNRDELIYAVANIVRQMSASLLKDVAGAAHERRTQARVVAATMIVDGLARYEVLSSDELPAMMGEETYSRPLARMRGEQLASGVTYSDD